MSDEARVFEKVSRATSAVSIACTAFILFTFFVFPYFRKPINRLVVYASVGNVLCNVATIISVTGIPEYGGSMQACRFQGFFMQMFMPADSMWTLSMALNVYLTFFRKYDANDLRNLEVRYLACNYGLPFLPAMIYLILDMSPLRPGLYGPAGLWCWISSDWEWVRFAFFYTPIWLIIVTIVCIYIRTGRVIFQQRELLRNVSQPSNEPSGRIFSDDKPIPLLETGNPFTANIHGRITRVTEIEVVCEDVVRDNDSMIIEQCKSDSERRSSFSSTRQLSPPPVAHAKENGRCPYTGQETACKQCYNSAIWPFSPARDGAHDTNRFYATASITTGQHMPEPKETPPLERVESGASAGQQKERHTQYGQANEAAWGYAKVAFLMFIALFIVWIPATINRVYAVLNHGQAPFGVAVSVAAVAPMQGFWNCAIWIATSWPQCKAAWRDTKKGCRDLWSMVAGQRRGEQGRMRGRRFNEMASADTSGTMLDTLPTTQQV